MRIEKKQNENFTAILELVNHRVESEGLLPAFYWPQDILLSELYMTDGFVAYQSREDQQLDLAPHLLGFILFRNFGFEYEISCLTTRVGFEGQGVMSALLSHLLATKPPGVKVFLEVHFENIKAQKLYERLGFIKISERQRYYKDGGAAYVYLAN